MKKTILLALLALLPGACVASDASGDCIREEMTRKDADFAGRLNFTVEQFALTLRDVPVELIEGRRDELIAWGKAKLLQMAQAGTTEVLFHDANGFVFKIYFLAAGGVLFVSRVASYNCLGEKAARAHQSALDEASRKLASLVRFADQHWNSGQAAAAFSAGGAASAAFQAAMNQAQAVLIETLYADGLREEFNSELFTPFNIRITKEMKLEVAIDPVFADLTAKVNPLAAIVKKRITDVLADPEATCPICADKLSEARMLGCWPCFCDAIYCKECLDKIPLQESCSCCRSNLSAGVVRLVMKREDKAGEASAAATSGGASGSATE